MTSPRQAYACARLHARHAARASPALWGALESSRTLAHYVDVLRAAGALRVPEAAIALDADALESSLRETWRATCAEFAAWHPPRWRAAYRWAAVLPDLAALECLRGARTPPAWLARDAAFAPLVVAAPAARGAALAATPFAPLARAWAAGGSLLDGWRMHWHATWPAADAAAALRLVRLEALVLRAAESRLRTRARRARLESALARARREADGTAAAGFCALALHALDLERIRGSFAARLVLADEPGGAPSRFAPSAFAAPTSATGGEPRTAGAAR